MGAPSNLRPAAEYADENFAASHEASVSTYYAALSRPPLARQLRDRSLKVEIARVHKENFDVYGTEKVWKQLRRERVEVGRDRVATSVTVEVRRNKCLGRPALLVDPVATSQEPPPRTGSSGSRSPCRPVG